MMPQGTVTEPDAEAVAQLLALSDERDQWLRRILAAWREGYACGREAGYATGYDQGVTEVQAHMAGIARDLYGEHSAAGWQARVRAAEAAGKRDQAEHERAFVTRAYNTPADLRTAVQGATVLAFRPRRPA